MSFDIKKFIIGLSIDLATNPLLIDIGDENPINHENTMRLYNTLSDSDNKEVDHNGYV